MYTWTCSYCNTEVTAPSPGEVTTQACDHVAGEHRAEVAEQFGRNLTGERCHECGIHQFDEPGSAEKFVCPDCGHDHLAFFAGKRVWDEVKRT